MPTNTNHSYTESAEYLSLKQQAAQSPNSLLRELAQGLATPDCQESDILAMLYYQRAGTGSIRFFARPCSVNLRPCRPSSRISLQSMQALNVRDSRDESPQMSLWDAIRGFSPFDDPLEDGTTLMQMLEDESFDIKVQMLDEHIACSKHCLYSATFHLNADRRIPIADTSTYVLHILKRMGYDVQAQLSSFLRQFEEIDCSEDGQDSDW